MLGRKRHVAVDTDWRLLMVNLTPADVSDGAGAQTILAAIRKSWPWLKHLFADAGYDRTNLMDKAAFLDFVVEIVRRSDKPWVSRSSLADGSSSAPSAEGCADVASSATTRSASTCPKP